MYTCLCVAEYIVQQCKVSKALIGKCLCVAVYTTAIRSLYRHVVCYGPLKELEISWGLAIQ